MTHWHIMTWLIGARRDAVKRHRQALHMAAPSALCAEYGAFAQLDYDTETESPYVRYLSACDARHNL